MSFTPTLKEAVNRVEGSISALIIGIDGMPVEEYAVEKLLNLDEMTAESSQMIKDINKGVESLGLGKATEFTIVTDLCTIIMRQITIEYYLVLMVKPGGNVGKGRYVLRVLEPQLRKEF